MGCPMIAWTDIERLRRRPPTPEGPVLSVYLDVDQRRAVNSKRGVVAALETRLRQLALSMGDADRRPFDHAAARVREVVERYEPHARTLVVMTDPAGELAWSGELQIAIPTDVRWGPRPHVQPLLEACDEHE